MPCSLHFQKKLGRGKERKLKRKQVSIGVYQLKRMFKLLARSNSPNVEPRCRCHNVMSMKKLIMLPDLKPCISCLNREYSPLTLLTVLGDFFVYRNRRKLLQFLQKSKQHTRSLISLSCSNQLLFDWTLCVVFFSDG